MDSSAASGPVELSYWEGVDGSGVTKRFQWHAQSAAARLGFGETGQKAVWFWLDRVRRDAPESHLRNHLFERPDGTKLLFSVEILDLCGLSAEYCIKCEADEISAGMSYQNSRRFEYQYPIDFPDVEQLSIENARLDADAELESTPVHSYDEHRVARSNWFWKVVSAAAIAIGRAGAGLNWGANKRRETLLDFAMKAAQSVGIFGRDGILFAKFRESDQWRALDQCLFPQYPCPDQRSTGMPPNATPAESAPIAKPGPQIMGPDELKQTNTKSSPPPPRMIRKVGDIWQVSFNGECVYVKDLKGLVYILYLLQSPGQTLHSMQLFSAASGQIELPRPGSAGEILDPKTFSQYRDRIDDIDTRLADAERNCDQGQKEALLEEKDRLDRELEVAVGLGGRPREAHSDAEKVRKSVSNAISRAIDAIREHHPSLADHLQHHIECGLVVRYSADEVPWEF